MPRINITFRAQTQSSTTGTISHTMEASQDLFESLNNSVYRRNGDAENWIKMNLFGRVSEIGVRESWQPVDVIVTRL